MNKESTVKLRVPPMEYVNDLLRDKAPAFSMAQIREIAMECGISVGKADGGPYATVQQLRRFAELAAITTLRAASPTAPAPAGANDYYRACERQNVELLEAIGYPPEKDTLISAEEYAADLKRKADSTVSGAPVVATVPAWCPIHEHHKWCEHNGGVMGSTGWEVPAGVKN